MFKKPPMNFSCFTVKPNFAHKKDNDGVKMKTAKTAFIVNTTAGRNRTSRIWPQLERQLRNIAEFSVFHTIRQGAGTEVAMEAQKQGFDRIIVVGGDGTLHEVVNGIDPAKCVIGIIPTGTGNDFCRSMDIPKDPFAAVDYIFSDNIRTIDLGCVNGRRFLNIAGIGFDAEAANMVNTSPVLRYLSGTVAYLAAVFTLLPTYTNIPISITVDQETVSSCVFLVAVGNSNYYGGGMKIVPQAVIDDGLFHLCLGKDISLSDALGILPKIFSGKHIKHPKVYCMSGKHITLTSSTPMNVHADGEIVSVTPADFTIIPSCLRVVYPKY